MFAPGAIASASTASFCPPPKRRRRPPPPKNPAVAYDIDLALLLAPVPSQHPASSSRRAQGGRHRRDTLVFFLRLDFFSKEHRLTGERGWFSGLSIMCSIICPRIGVN